MNINKILSFLSIVLFCFSGFSQPFPCKKGGRWYLCDSKRLSKSPGYDSLVKVLIQGQVKSDTLFVGMKDGCRIDSIVHADSIELEYLDAQGNPYIGKDLNKQTFRYFTKGSIDLLNQNAQVLCRNISELNLIQEGRTIRKYLASSSEKEETGSLGIEANHLQNLQFDSSWTFLAKSDKVWGVMNLYGDTLLPFEHTNLKWYTNENCKDVYWYALGKEGAVYDSKLKRLYRGVLDSLYFFRFKDSVNCSMILKEKGLYYTTSGSGMATRSNLSLVPEHLKLAHMQESDYCNGVVGFCLTVYSFPGKVKYYLNPTPCKSGFVVAVKDSSVGPGYLKNIKGAFFSNDSVDVQMRFGLINTFGEITIPFKYSNIRLLGAAKPACANDGDLFLSEEIVNRQVRYRVFDAQGRALLPDSYDGLNMIESGKNILILYQNGKTIRFDLCSRMVLN